MEDRINTTIPGSVSGIRAASDWLSALAKAESDASLDLFNTRRVLMGHWWGASADAYYARATQLLKSDDSAESLASFQADALAAYADQIVWRQEDMDGLRKRALDGGLDLTLDAIIGPATVPDYPGLAVGSSPDQLAAWSTGLKQHIKAVAQIDLFNQLCDEAKQVIEHLQTWIARHLITKPGDDYLRRTLQAIIADDNLAGGITVAGAAWSAAKLREAVRRSAEMSSGALAAAIARTAARSGNPAVRAGKTAPSLDSVDRAISNSAAAQSAANAPTRVASGARLAKVFESSGTVGGLTLTAAAGIDDIRNGGSPSSNIVGAAAGYVGGMAGVALADELIPVVVGGLAAFTEGTVVGGALTALTGAVVVALPVMLGIVAAGAAVGGVVWLWENALSEQDRGAIDEGLSDVWGGLQEDASQGWDRIFG